MKVVTDCYQSTQINIIFGFRDLSSSPLNEPWRMPQPPSSPSPPAPTSLIWDLIVDKNRTWVRWKRKKEAGLLQKKNIHSWQIYFAVHYSANRVTTEFLSNLTFNMFCIQRYLNLTQVLVKEKPQFNPGPAFAVFLFVFCSILLNALNFFQRQWLGEKECPRF